MKKLINVSLGIMTSTVLLFCLSTTSAYAQPRAAALPAGAGVTIGPM